MKKIDENYFVKEPSFEEEDVHSYLEEEEEVLWEGKPNRKSFILNQVLRFLPFAIIFLIFDLSFLFVLLFVIPGVPWWAYLMLGIFFLFHLLPFWFWIYGALSAAKRQEKEEYLFTDRRIIVKKGFVGATVVSLYYDALISVNIRIGLIEKMCKVGDIYIVAGNQREVLEDIPDPYFIGSKLQAIARTKKADVYFPNVLREKIEKDLGHKE